jgi:hypothetical protein
MPYAPQGVKGLDDDDDNDVEYLMEHFLIISSANAIIQSK